MSNIFAWIIGGLFGAGASYYIAKSSNEPSQNNDKQNTLSKRSKKPTTKDRADIKEISKYAEGGGVGRNVSKYEREKLSNLAYQLQNVEDSWIAKNHSKFVEMQNEYKKQFKKVYGHTNYKDPNEYAEGGGVGKESNFGKPGTGFDNPRYNSKNSRISEFYGDTAVSLTPFTDMRMLGANIKIERNYDDTYSWVAYDNKGIPFKKGQKFKSFNEAIFDFQNTKFASGGGVDAIVDISKLKRFAVKYIAKYDETTPMKISQKVVVAQSIEDAKKQFSSKSKILDIKEISKYAEGGGVGDYKITKQDDDSVIIELPFNAYKTKFDLQDRVNLQRRVNEDLKKNFDWWGFNVQNNKTYVVLGKNKYSNGGGVGDENDKTMREKIAEMNIALNTKNGQVYVGGIKPKNRLFKDEKGYYVVEGYGKFMGKKYPLKKHFSISENEVLDAYMQDKYAKGGGVGDIESQINALYSKSGFINDDFNWRLKLLEMLQDQSIEAYNIYQKLSKNQKDDVLQEQFELDNDMGSDGDGDIETSKENINILLDDAKNGKKYNRGGGVGNYRSLINKFNKEKPSILLGIIAREVAEDFMREKFDRTIDWNKLTDAQKADYNKNYKLMLNEFESYLIKDFLTKYYSNSTFNSKFKGQSRKTLDAIYKHMNVSAKSYPTSKYKHGGHISNENADMVANNNKEIAHHTKELQSAIKKVRHVPAWAVSRVERAATDLSDVTHYLEGESSKNI